MYEYVRPEQLNRASNFGVVRFIQKTRISDGKSRFKSSMFKSIAARGKRDEFGLFPTFWSNLSHTSTDKKIQKNVVLIFWLPCQRSLFGSGMLLFRLHVKRALSRAFKNVFFMKKNKFFFANNFLVKYFFPSFFLSNFFFRRVKISETKNLPWQKPTDSLG